MHCEHTYRKVSLPDFDSELSFTYVFLCSVGGHKKMSSTTREFTDEREFENLENQSTESTTSSYPAKRRHYLELNHLHHHH